MKEILTEFVENHPYICVGFIFLILIAIGVVGLTGNPWIGLVVVGALGAIGTGMVHDLS